MLRVEGNPIAVERHARPRILAFLLPSVWPVLELDGIVPDSLDRVTVDRCLSLCACLPYTYLQTISCQVFLCYKVVHCFIMEVVVLVVVVGLFCFQKLIKLT